MTRSNSPRRSVSLIALCSLLLVGTACGDKGKAVKPATNNSAYAADTVHALWGTEIGEQDTEVAQSAPPITDLGGPFQGALETSVTSDTTPFPSMKIDAMTDAQLVAYLNQLEYDMSLDHSELVLLPCRKNNQACKRDSLANVYVQPEVGMKYVAIADDPSNNIVHIPSNGVVAARLINYSPTTVAGLKLPPGQRAWWYIDSVPASGGNPAKLRSRFFVRNYSPVGKGAVFVGPTLEFKGCPGHLPAPRSRPSIAKWRSCDYDGGLVRRTPTAAPRKMGSLFRPVSWLQDSTATDSSENAFRGVKGSVWITCGLGCCVGA